MGSILRQVEEIKNLCSTRKMDCTVFLLDRKRGDPDGNEAVLTKGQTEVRMCSDLEEVPSVVPGICKLTSGWAAKRNAAKAKGASIECKLLLVQFALFTDKGDASKRLSFYWEIRKVPKTDFTGVNPVLATLGWRSIAGS